MTYLKIQHGIALEAADHGKSKEITLKQVFDEIFEGHRFDSNFMKKVNHYQIKFINRNQDHLEFFGGNLLGVQVIRFKDSDVTKFFEEVLDLDYDDVKSKVRTVTTINHSFKIAGDVFNLTLSYLLHKSLTSEYLDETKRHRAAMDVALVFFYRSVCAVHSYYIKYPFDAKIAQEAYSRLSGKFLIKQLGSWHEVMLYRAHALTDKGALHRKALMSYMDDTDTVYVIEDSQGRIKDLIKNYAIELYKVHEEGASLSTTSSTMIDMDGEETIRDKTGTPEGKIQHLRNLLNDKNAFINDDYISVIAKTNSNTSARIIKSTLIWIVDNYSVTKFNRDIDEFLSKVVIQSLYMIETSIPINKRRDTPYILKTIKDLYLSTRTLDKDILRIRELGDKIVNTANGRVSSSLALSTRTSIILYITLRLMALG